MKMTISQALRKIKKLKGQLSEYKTRCHTSVSWSKKPAFDFNESLKLFKETQEELIKLEASLAITNASTNVDFAGRKITLSEATRRLQELKGLISWFDTLPVRDHRETTEQERMFVEDKYVTSNVEYICELPRQQQAEAVEKMQAEFDELNDSVETINHRTVLHE